MNKLIKKCCTIEDRNYIVITINIITCNIRIGKDVCRE